MRHHPGGITNKLAVGYEWGGGRIQRCLMVIFPKKEENEEL